MELQTQLEELQKKYQQKLEQEENPGNDNVTITELQTQLAQKTTLISDSKLKEQEFREQIHNLEDRLKKYEKNVYATTVGHLTKVAICTILMSHSLENLPNLSICEKCFLSI